MTMKINPWHPPITTEEIEALETRKQISLPADYKAFLLHNNGGRPDARVRFDVPDWPGKSAAMGDFLAICSEENGLEFWIDEFSDRLPHGFVPIGSDPGGNFLCMDTLGEERGRIYYWDSSPDWDIPEGSPTMFLVANNINDFLDKLEVSSGEA